MVAVGFVGLGVMGLPMAEHLAAAGHPLTVYDLSASACERLKTGRPAITVAASARDVAAASEVVITMLPHGRAVESVVFGPHGLAEGFQPGSLLVDTSSSEPWYTRNTAAKLAGAGTSMVDAPVSGAEIGAQRAELVFMVGGEPAAVDRARPLLTAMGKSVFHLGPVGAGHAMKSINNLITAITFLATAEGLVIGRRYGLHPGVMTQVLNVSTGMSWISRTHIDQRIISRRFDDPFKLELMVKDIDIALRLAGDAGLEVPLSAANQALWHQAQREIPSGASVSELVRDLETRTGVQITSPQ
jgi:3-hydroxyisobutyrate dehydrogenase